MINKDLLAKSILKTFYLAEIPGWGIDGWTDEVYQFNVRKSKLPMLAQSIADNYEGLISLSNTQDT